MNTATVIMDGFVRIIIILCVTGLIIRIMDWIAGSVDEKEKE